MSNRVAGFRRLVVSASCLVMMLFSFAGARAIAQGLEFTGRPIRQITLDGLERIEPKLIENALRAQVGQPYDPDIVEQDIVRITNLGYFGEVTAHAQQSEDDGVLLEYRVSELPILRSVDVRGEHRD